jgi:protein O-mannosyl-transferase
LSLKRKKDFIRQNQNLPAEDLAAKTGLSQSQVQKLLDRIETDKRTGPQQDEGSAVKNKIHWAVAFVPALLTFLFYLPLLHHDFVYWDDPAFITQNPNIRFLNPQFFHWMWTTLDTGNWMPLSWLSLALDYHWMGLNPKIYHLTNLLFHGINTTLVFILGLKVLQVTSRQRDGSIKDQDNLWVLLTALLTAILFGLHPIHVESVAWAAERRDVLYAFFYLLALLFYLDYAQSPQMRIKKLIVCFGFFLLALMSKPMAVTLPLILLVMDLWPLARLRSPWARILLEKIPFLLASLVLGIITISAQSGVGAMGPSGGLTLAFRVMNAFHSVIFYLVKMAVPIHLVPFYPIIHPEENTFTAVNFTSALLVLLISFFCWRQWKKEPYWAAAWLFYLISLAPALGILQTGIQAAGDRFTYLSSLGLFLLFAGIATKLLLKNRAVLILFFGGLTLALSAGTWFQLVLWKDSISLWESVVRIYPDVSQLAETNLGTSYEAAGRLEDALREYNRALTLPPTNPHVLDLKGLLLLKEGRIDEAIEAFKSAIALEPVGDPTLPYQHLWLAYEKKGLQPEALAVVESATSKYPASALLQYYLGISDWYAHQAEKSEEAFQKAFALEPDNPEYLTSLASLYQKQGRDKEAIDLYKEGIEKLPQEPVYYLNLGKIYLAKNLFPNAVEMLQTAAQIQTNNPEIFQFLGQAYEKQGQPELAAQSFERAKILGNPGH